MKILYSDVRIVRPGVQHVHQVLLREIICRLKCVYIKTFSPSSTVNVHSNDITVGFRIQEISIVWRSSEFGARNFQSLLAKWTGAQASRLNPLSPKIQIQILQTGLHTFLLRIVERIWFKIKAFSLVIN